MRVHNFQDLVESEAAGLKKSYLLRPGVYGLRQSHSEFLRSQSPKLVDPVTGCRKRLAYQLRFYPLFSQFMLYADWALTAATARVYKSLCESLVRQQSFCL